CSTTFSTAMPLACWRASARELAFRSRKWVEIVATGSAGPGQMTQSVRKFLRDHRDEQTEFLAALVRVPSDNPPGDCQPIADAAAQLLEGLCLAVERHPVPGDRVVANGMISATNLVVRHRFGSGPTIALNAHGDVVAPGA